MAKEYVDTIIFPQGGLNTDDDLLILPPGDARYRENVILSDDSNFNVLTNVLGNTLKNASGGGTFTYPGGSIRVIGYVENKEEKAGIFFIFSSTGEHSIAQYYSETDTLEYILRGGSSVSAPIGIGSILNFDIDSPVDSGIIGNENDKYLIWTDGVNEPRMINIQMAINFTAGTGTPIYSSISEDILRFYKIPYLGDLTVEYDSITSNINNLRGKIWQFAIRKKFIDNTYSVLSPYTEVAFPQEEEFSNGFFVDNQETNNALNIFFAYDNDDEIVDVYQLCYRIVDFGGGVPSEWYLANINMGLYGGSTPYFQFLGDTLDLILASSDANRIYDYVPDLASHLFVIDSNRVVFGGITEGFNNIDSSTLDINFAIHKFHYNTNSLEFISPWSFQLGPTDYDDFYFSKSLSDDKSYSVFISGYGTFNYLTTYNKTEVEVATYLANLIDAEADFSCSVLSLPSNGIRITNDGGSTVQVTMTINQPFIKEKSFKNGTRQFFGIQYLNNGKPSYVQTSKDFYIDVPYQYEALTVPTYTGTQTTLGGPTTTLTDSTNRVGIYAWENGQLDGIPIRNVTTATTGTIIQTFSYYLITDINWSYGDVYEIYWEGFLSFYNKIKWSINHLPPNNSTHYQWVYLGQNVEYYEYYLLDDTTSISLDGNFTRINKNFLTYFTNAFSSINYGFDFQKGDRIRFIGFPYPPDYTTYYLSASNILFDELFDYEILAVDSTYLYIRNIGTLNDLLGYDLIYAEIYRPKALSEDNTYFQAISPVFEIYDDSGTLRHRGETQDQTSSLPAEGVFNSYFSNCVVYLMAYMTGDNNSDYSYDYTIYGPTENYPVSLFYDSKIESFGKTNIKNELAKKDYYNSIRWGGQFFDDSGVNFISKFDYDDIKTLDDRNGLITKIQQIGDTLKVYQERMTNSFYLKTTSSTAADGSQAYVFSSNVMSDARQSVFEYGCTHYTSYIKTVREAFYFDIINACVIKDTPAGPIVISDQKMHTYFKSKAREILDYTAGTVLILGGYDEDLDMYLLTFIDPDDSNSEINETIGYFLPTERWISFYSFIPEYYGKISGDTAITFCDGQMYLQNSNSTRNNFCGTQYTSIVDIHSNVNAPLIKEFDSIEIVSTGIWSPNQDTDIEINLPDFMQSRILEGKFKRQEGIYSSEFLKDALVDDGTGTKTFVRQQLHSGRTLRGHEIRVCLRNDDTSESNLRLVIIKGNISK